jgi:glycerol-3-phosphate cytidylyltransferase-like family protein
MFELASKFGELYVGIGSDESITKHKHPVYRPQAERLYMVKAVRHVKDASINPGEGLVDYIKNPMFINADILIVAEERESKEMKMYCNLVGKEYVIFGRIHAMGLPEVSSTDFRK